MTTARRAKELRKLYREAEKANVALVYAAEEGRTADATRFSEELIALTRRIHDLTLVATAIAAGAVPLTGRAK